MNNEYALTWGSVAGVVYFAIIDAQGNVVVPATAISDSAVNASGGYNVFVSYNSVANQYFFTWQDSLNNVPHFAIYNANGTVHVAVTAIPSPDSVTAPFLVSSYNTLENQYLITWNDENQNGYFALYDAAGTAVVPATLFADTVSEFNYGSVFSSYNPQKNAYFLTWESVDGNSQYALLDASGAVSVAATDIPNVTGVVDYGFVTNSYGINDGAFFISWIGPESSTNGYFAIYGQINPPSQASGQHLLNRFANYGEYFNKLQWTMSTTPNITNYNVYRAGNLIAMLPPLQTTYEDHNQPNVPQLYSITAVQNGAESVPLNIQV